MTRPWGKPLVPAPPPPLLSHAEHLARTRYLEAVQFAHHRYEMEVAAAATTYRDAEDAAWNTYQASKNPRRKPAPRPQPDPGRWTLPPAASTHPYPNGNY